MIRDVQLRLSEALLSRLQALSQAAAMQLGLCVINFLQNGNQEALVNARAELARIVGLCRLFGARRAALFCSELEEALLHHSAGHEQWAHARLQHSTRARTLSLLARGVVQLQHYLTGFTLPVADEVFDMARINELRSARGKVALTPGAAPREPPCAIKQFPVPDFPQLMLMKIATLQAGLYSVDNTCDEEKLSQLQGQHLAELASLLEVCGSSPEMSRLPFALVHLELYFRYLCDYCQPCTPARIVNIERRPADEYLLLDARRTLSAIISGRLDVLLGELAENIVGTAGNPAEEIRKASQEFTLINEALGLLVQSGILTAPADSELQLLQYGKEFCRHISCGAGARFAEENTARECVLLLMRIFLSLRKFLTLRDRQVRYVEQAVRRVSRDCVRFIMRRQNDLRRRMVVQHQVDAELLSTASAEIEDCRHALLVSLSEISNAQGIHYVSEALCTTVSKLSQVFLATGQVEMHEITEELREILIRELEHQQCVDGVLTDALAALCDMLQRNPSLDLDKMCCTDTDRQRFAQLVSRCVVRLRWARSADDQTEYVAVHWRDDPQSQVRVAVKLLPVHLARNLGDLLFFAEELGCGVQSPARFEDLNRRLIVELRMLAAGASALHVQRVAGLSAVLAEVHQAIADANARRQGEAEKIGELPMAMLTTAHRQLRSGLNQAAARQEVSSNREIIAELYEWLETISQQIGSCEASEEFSIFHREAEEIIARIEEGVTKPSDELDTGELLHNLHTLKGNARMFSANVVAALCHRCEQALLSVARAGCVTSAVAESGSNVIYGSAGSAADATRATMAGLAHQLRAAVDDLKPVAATREVDMQKARKPTRIPLSMPCEHGVVIDAVSLKRMAELAAAARTGSRAMSDVLQSCCGNEDSSRMHLLGELVVEQERYAIQLGEEIAGSTCISFSRLSPRLQRLAGRHSNLLDKQLSFQVCNDELRADRAVVESLVAPLEQLLRNAIDHGIEPVLQRRARGKPDNGSVTMTLEEKGDLLVIELKDDGAGIDLNELPAHARRLGIAVDLQSPKSERLRWLFLPGFSSRECPTEDAGHGIGLAMVASAVSELGGHMEVESVPGKGSTFRIILLRSRPRWDIVAKPV